MARGNRSAVARFTGSLYQLHSRSQLQANAYVAVNGPHDTYGRVLRSDPTTDGNFLNLIRGVPADILLTPQAQF